MKGDIDMSSIKVSEKYGVNPTIPICFWCGETRNEIALLGKLKGDAEAPKQAIIDYNPCDKCKEKMDQGITMIQAKEVPCVEGQAPLRKGAYPTGKWVVVKEESLDIFTPETKKQLLEQRKCFVDVETWKKIGLPE
jgi:hypothetical protein